MKADLEWIDKLAGGVKRKVRITFPGRGKVKWQFKRSDEDTWDYDTPPSRDDWTALEEKTEALYNRQRIPYKHFELVRKLKKNAEADAAEKQDKS